MPQQLVTPVICIVCIKGKIGVDSIKNHLLYVTAQFRLGRIRIVVSIPACHAGGRGSIPRFGESFCHL